MIRAVALLLALTAPALAQPVCGTAQALGAHGAAQASAPGAAAASRDGVLAVWTTNAQAQLNADYGLILTFADGGTCDVALSERFEHGAAIPVTRRPVTVEAGICDDQRGLCVPVRLRLGPNG